MSVEDNNTVANYVAGAAAGAAQTFIGFPLDTLKTRLQASGVAFKGPLDCLWSTFRVEGVRGFYKGMASPLVAGSFFNAILFGTYEELTHRLSDDDGNITVPRYVLACALTGVAESTAYTPIEMVKVRLQVDVSTGGASRGPLAVTREVLRNNGLRGLFKGHQATLMRECPGNVVYFSSYEVFKKLYPRESEVERSLVAGGCAGMSYWVAMLPVDSIKTKLQTDSLSAPRYAGVLDCVRQTVAEHGVRGLYRGLTPVMLRAFPANAVAFGAFEFVLSEFRRFSSSHLTPGTHAHVIEDTHN